jgi:hypothetical protein
MKKLLIACETIQNEIEMALNKHGVTIDTIWMPNTLHDSPERLRDALQEEINKAEENYDIILFAYGNCGNGLLGLKSKKVKFVIPRYGDCIDMLLCEKENIERIRTTTYFLTKGWLKGGKTLDAEYQHNVEKYGQKRADYITHIMFKHYKTLMLIDTGAYDPESVWKRVNAIGRIIGLEVVLSPGSISVMEKLILGQWEDKFCIIPPGRETTYEDFEGVKVQSA